MKKLDELKKDFSKENFIGKVVFNEDPDMIGRCKVKVIGLFDDLEDELIPWFSPGNISIFSSEAGGGAFSVPKIGTWVRVRFVNGDIYSGEYTSIQNIDPNMFTSDPALDKESYLDTHVLLWDSDHELSVSFQPSNGLILYYMKSKIVIAPDGKITLYHQDGTAQLEITDQAININSTGTINITGNSIVDVTGGTVNINADNVNIGKNASVPAVNGNALKILLTTIIQAIQMKYPVSPGAPNESMVSSILSNTVKIQP